jgi:ribosomal-protein-alanine N-acetyltransferase
MSESNIRWMTLQDIEQIIEIENKAFPYPWDQSDFNICLRKKNIVGVVLLDNKKIIAYMIFEFKKTLYEIISLAVDPKFQKAGNGRKLVEYLKQTIRSSKDGPINKISLVVSDQNLNCHQFLRNINFKAIKVQKDYFGPMHDAYHFIYDFKEKKQTTSKNTRKRKRSLKDGLE